jgi:hypothetical protein
MKGSLFAILALVCSARAEVDFVHDVLPILRIHCTECHTGNQKKGGLSISTRGQLLEGSEFGEVVAPGNAQNSLMIKLLRSQDEDEWMPPKGPRLSQKEIMILERWIDEGLAWPNGVQIGALSWEPSLSLREVSLPPVYQGREHSIDRILDADLMKRNARLPELVDDRSFIRRATLDVIGLLPTPSELDSFLKDQNPKKRVQLIEKLLSKDISYADHWLSMWNDLLRNDYTGTGFITGGRKQITSWLYKALRDNKPYDQFVRELIAPGPESEGFINGIQWRGDVNGSQTRAVQFSQNISQVFLGINMKCASCHDSFIDRWKLDEAYGLAAIFSDEPLELHRCDKPTGVMAQAKWIFPEIGEINPHAPKDERLSQLASLMTHEKNGRFSRTLVNRYWARLMGRGIVHPVDAMDTKPWNEDLLEVIAVQFQRDGYDLKKLISWMMTSKAYQSKSELFKEEPSETYQYHGPLAKRMSAEQFLDAIWQVAEVSPVKTDAKVDRRKISRFSKKEDMLEERPNLAHWIWHQGETGRKSQLRKKFVLERQPDRAVMMATCDNAFVMKINGATVASSQDWTSPVYLEITDALRQGENLIEVEAEMFGGSAGLIAEFVFKNQGKQSSLFTDSSWEARPPNGAWFTARELNKYGEKPWGQVFDNDLLKRALLEPEPPVRAALVKNDFLMRSLGRPPRDQVITSRPDNLTTLQAIDLANGAELAGHFSKAANALAERFKRQEDFLDWIYLYSLSRLPNQREIDILSNFASKKDDQQNLEDLLWLILMKPEFQIVR